MSPSFASPEREAATLFLCKCPLNGRRKSSTEKMRSRLWPISIVTESFEQHLEECPYAPYSKAQTRIVMNLHFCSYLLRRKVTIALQLFSSNSRFTISPMLQATRIVPIDSPSFTFISDLRYSYETNSAHILIHDLKRLFDANQASPYDRLSDGTTLLHYAIQSLSRWEKTRTDRTNQMLGLSTAVITFLLNVMGRFATETNDMGRWVKRTSILK